MSFFSRSSKGKHYKNGHRGSTHYKNQGVLGSILNMLDISHSRKGHGQGQGPGHLSNQQPYNQPYQQPTHPPSINVTSSRVQEGLHCKKCQTLVPMGSKFCLQCGERMVTDAFCMECGKKLPQDAKFCMECGKKVSS